MHSNLSNDRVFVSAASKGLGKAVAQKFVEEGATVAIGSSSQRNLASAKEDILAETEASGDAVQTVKCDLSNESDVTSVIDTAASRLGGLSILVTNHAGPTVVPFEDSTVEQLDDSYQSILRSTYLIIQTAIPHLRDSPHPVITNIISTSAREPKPGNILSSTIRPGILGLSKALSKEYGGDGFRVNCVTPRGIFTDRTRHKLTLRAEQAGMTYEEAYQERGRAVPLNRMGEPDEFANAVVFISSSDASFINGAILDVDGGWTQAIH